MCKYVRREIRELTASDRSKYLSAVELFHRLDADVGRQMYGDKWTNAKESVIKHLARMTLDGCTVRTAFSFKIYVSLKGMKILTP